MDGDNIDALKWVLALDGKLADEGRVVDFLRYAVGKKLDLRLMGVVEREDRIEWAVLPVLSPGRSVLLLTPCSPSRGEEIDQAAGVLLQKLVDSLTGVKLIQGLVDPSDERSEIPLRLAGFEKLARLVYLQRSISREPVSSPPPGGLRAVTYSSSTHELFKHALSQSYTDSHDCARLNGVRNLDDVVEDHKHTGGLFDPSLWTVLTDAEQPASIFLMNPTETADTMELVYLGVSPAYRRQGLAHWMLREAMSQTFRRGLSKLTLAVDAGNSPALRVYYRFGMKRIHERTAMVRLS